MSLSKENKVVIDGQTYYGGLNQPNLKFIKVNVDCWERIFDFLALHDILAMSQTCQRMRQIGGHYYRENFHEATCCLSGPSNSLCITINEIPIERADFLRFVDAVEIGGGVIKNLEHLRTVSSMDLLGSLTALRLDGMNGGIVLNEHQLHGLENVQTNIEAIDLSYCSIGDNFVGEFLASCRKLKRLSFSDVQFKSAAVTASLFQRTYPMLEHIECTYCKDAARELPSFLERNPSIKGLKIEAFDFQEISLNSSSIQLDYLNIGLANLDNFSKLIDRLKTLHANGKFKKLRLHAVHLDKSSGSELFMQEMASFSALEVLYTVDYYTDKISQLTQLKELYLCCLFLLDDDIDFETMAKNLGNLERLRIDCAVDELLLFIRHSKKLKLVCFFDEDAEYNALNLFNLNEARKMAGTQCKVQIGVIEEQYLTTKCKANNLNYDLVEINRYEKIRKYFDYI